MKRVLNSLTSPTPSAWATLLREVVQELMVSSWNEEDIDVEIAAATMRVAGNSCDDLLIEGKKVLQNDRAGTMWVTAVKQALEWRREGLYR